MCVCLKNRVDAILIGCRCYKNAQPPLQEQIDGLGVWERMKAKVSPSAGHFFEKGTFQSTSKRKDAPSSGTSSLKRGPPARTE